MQIEIDTRQIVALVNRLRAAPFAIRQESERVLDKVQGRIIALMQARTGPYSDPGALVHEISGDLSASLHKGAVHTTAQGVEGSIEPGVSYAEEEVARGGSHDYPVRTVRASGEILQAGAEELAQGVADVLEGPL